jgi:hypothetical protein
MVAVSTRLPEHADVSPNEVRPRNCGNRTAAHAAHRPPLQHRFRVESGSEMPANAPAARSTSARDIAAASVGDGRVVVRALHKILRRDLLGEMRRAERRPSERAYLVEPGCGQRDAADSHVGASL